MTQSLTLLGASGTGGVTFSPTDIAGLEYWFKADGLVYSDLGTTPAVNLDPVEQWNDQSGNSRNLTQTTLANRPVFNTGVKNGLPAILFDGVDDRISNATGATIAQPITVVTVLMMPNTITTNTRNYYDHVSTASTRPSASVIDTTQNFRMTAGTATDSGVSKVNGTWYIVFNFYNGASSTYRINGVDVGPVNPGTNGYTSGNGYRLGANGAATQLYPGYIGEQCVYNSIISGANLTNLEGYLNSDTRWDVY